MTSSNRGPLAGQIGNRNFLSPVGFKFVIGRTPNVDYFCQSASIPEVNIGVREVPTPVKDYLVPGDKKLRLPICPASGPREIVIF